MSNKKNIIISGYYGFGNSGDDAILKAIVDDLRKSEKDLNITALSRKPKDTKKYYNIDAVDRFNIFEIMKSILNTDLFISGGGSLIQDVTSTRSIIYYLSLILISKIFNKKVMVYANGIGPIKKRFNRLLTKQILSKVDLITLRDYISKNTIDKIGVRNNNVIVTADPVYTLQPSDEDRVSNILDKEGISLEKPLVGVSIRNWKNSDNIKDMITQLINYLLNNYSVNVVLIPMHYSEDLGICREISNMVEGSCYLIENQYSVEEMMGIISNLELIVAMRLHSLVYAATQAVPMIGLVYDPKVKGFMNSINQDSMCDVDELEIVDLCTKFDKVWKKKDSIKEELKSTREKFRKKAQQNVDLAIDLLKSR